MSTIFLDDEILMQVEKPARYIGGEINAVKKDPSEVDVRFCMCFPDVYEVGMSHLGIQILYDLFNRREDTYCERVYSPWVDMDKLMREKNIPLFSIETKTPVKEFDFLGITLQYEMCYTNVLQVLDLAGIPLLSKDRTENDPIVIGGGPCAYNPEPIADFFDIFYIGEGETVYDEMIELYKKLKKEGKGRREILHAIASRIEGLYIPAFYTVSYKENGEIAEFKPVFQDIPARIKRQVVTDPDNVPYPEKPIVPYTQAIQDRVVLEIMRGCIRGCRFCQAGQIYKPVRERSLSFLKDKAKKMIDSTGYDEINLSSLSSSDYSQLKELVYWLIDEYKDRGVNISLPSLRIDSFSLDVMGKVQDISKSSLTFAPEAGTQRLRNVINKGLTEDDIFRGATDAFKLGWNKVKLYFMLGLPFETDEDVSGIPVLAEQIAEKYYEAVPKEQRKGKVAVTISTSFFVPKPFTPFQWAPMIEKNEYERRKDVLLSTLNKQLNRRSIRYNWHDAKTSELEAVLARGDRKLCKTVLKAYENGALYDAWTDHFVYENWEKAMHDTGVELDFYIYRERTKEELLPWDFIELGVTKDFLWREYMNAKEGKVTKNCRESCAGCGCGTFSAGICTSKRN